MSRSRRSRGGANERAGFRGGFTLVEVLLVLIIMVIIGSIVVPNLFGVKAQADIDATKAQISSLKSVMSNYHLHLNKYPPNLKALMEEPSDKAQADKWRGPYLEGSLKPDPWGNEFQYLAQGKKNPKGYDLWSNGPDGQSGTDDDIGNWE